MLLILLILLIKPDVTGTDVIKHSKLCHSANHLYKELKDNSL